LLLKTLGFGLDLKACAATGKSENLIYVSPKTGRAVSAAAGEPYRDKLLALPAFLAGGAVSSRQDIRAGLMLTGHFLETHLLHQPDAPVMAARARLLGYFP